MSVVRCFAPLAVTTTVEPLFGTTLGQAVKADGLNAQTVTVGNTSFLFRNNDTAVVFPATPTGQADAPPVASETAIQLQVVSSTQVKAIFQRAHSAGDFLVLSHPCSNIMVQAVNANPPSASIWLSCLQTVTTAGVGAFHDLLLTLFYSGPPGVLVADNTSNYWTIAASGTQYCLPSAVSND
jgi:hypothetical protein